jgi:hypothetical protein
VSDENPLEGFFEAQEALSRLTPEQLAAFDKEAVWIRKQIAAGRTPSPEKLVAKAPIYLRLLADLGDDEYGY